MLPGLLKRDSGFDIFIIYLMFWQETVHTFCSIYDIKKLQKRIKILIKTS